MKVRDKQRKETKKNMKNDKSNKWTSYNKLNSNLELPSKVQRLKRLNKILTFAIAAMVGVLIPLFFTVLVLAVA